MVREQHMERAHGEREREESALQHGTLQMLLQECALQSDGVDACLRLLSVPVVSCSLIRIPPRPPPYCATACPLSRRQLLNCSSIPPSLPPHAALQAGQQYMYAMRHSCNSLPREPPAMKSVLPINRQPRRSRSTDAPPL